MLNYHKRKEFEEDNDPTDVFIDKIKTLTDFKKYTQSRKPKNKKKSANLLRTPCSACFSDISQISNPLINCPECKIRVHRTCQKVDNRCHRCRYGRTGNAEKKQSGYCYICNRECEKGLMIVTVTKRAPHRYAHNFCLLLHNLWKIEERACLGKYTEPEKTGSICTICTKQGYLIPC